MPGACLALGVPGRADSPGPEDPDQQVRQLIEQLGSKDLAEAAAAEVKLEEIGPAALPALREAILNPDKALSDRADRVYNRIINLDAGRREALRARGRSAFQRADVEAMVGAYWRVAVALDAPAEDCLWLGHAHQLAGRWKQAVEAYQLAVDRIDALLKVPPAPDAAGTGEGDLELPGRRRVGKGGTRPPDRLPLLRQRATLLVWIGLLQRDQLRDAKAAVASFAAALAGEKPSDHQMALICERARAELVVALKRAGELVEAMKVCREIYRDKRKTLQAAGEFGSYIDPAVVARLVREYPPGKDLPQTPGLIVLTEHNASAQLELNLEQSDGRAYREARYRDSRWWFFALSAPPGKELAALEFALDVEQRELRYGGHLRCWAIGEGPEPVRINIGSIGWPKDTPPGRMPCRGRFDVPSAAGAVLFEVCSWPGKFQVHSLKLDAQLRPRRPGPAPQPVVWVQNEVLPAGGKLTLNREAMRGGVATDDLKPGKYAIAYELPGRKDAFRCEVELLAGGRYGLFVNLDSPFRWSLTALRGFEVHPPASASIAALADGCYLAAWCSRGGQVMLSASKDLSQWQEPWPLPHNSALFKNVSPALLADGTGNVYLSYFSNRLYLEGFDSSAGFLLFLARTRDGQNWSAPRPVATETAGGWPIDPVQMLHDAKGRYWMFWRTSAASGETLDELTALSPVRLGLPEGMQVCRSHVAIDDSGRMHMVFDDFGRGLYYTSSADGADWSPPVWLVGPKPNQGLSHGQLILHQGQGLLIYSENDGAYLCPMTLGKEVHLGPAVKITNHVIPLSGSRIFVGSSGQVALLAGADTVWVLRAKLDDLFAGQELPATQPGRAEANGQR